MREAPNCAKKCGKRLVVRICAGDGYKCDSAPAALICCLCSRMLDKSPEEHDLWAEILNDVGTASTNKEKKCLLVLGDAFVGKTTLINRLIRSEGQTYVQKAGVGLEYSFLDIKVEHVYSWGTPRIFICL